MILILESESVTCNWTLIDFNLEEFLKTRTEGLNLGKLDVFNVCDILYSIKELFKIKEEIKILMLLYAEDNMCKKNQSNLRLIFRDYFPNARITIDKV